jgi:site-specific DNA-methyltransferase (adenine-specific)
MEFNSTDLFDSTEPPTCGKPVLNAAFTSDLVSEVYNMDCIQGMKKYPDKYFDLAIVDPPYGIGADKKQNKAAEQRERANGKTKAGRGWKRYKETDWDNSIPTLDYWIELFRVSKNQIVWGGNYFTETLPPSMGWITWDKGQRDFSLADGELAWTSFNKAMRIFEMSRGEALSKNNQTGGRFHPTQKPVKLYEWQLLNYAEKGMKILDTHLGSGSSRIAAHNLGFHFVGFELDKEYYEAQEKRFRTHISQQRLF